MKTSSTANFIHFNPSWYQKLSNNVARMRNTPTTGNFASIKAGHKIKISPDSHLFLEKLSPYQRVQLSGKITALSPTPRPHNASPLKNTNNIYSIVELSTGFSINYKIQQGTVYILEITPNPELKGTHKELWAISRDTLLSLSSSSLYKSRYS